MKQTGYATVKLSRPFLTAFPLGFKTLFVRVRVGPDTALPEGEGNEFSFAAGDRVNPFGANPSVLTA